MVNVVVVFARRMAAQRRARPPRGDGGERRSNASPAGVGSRFSGDVEVSDRRAAAGANVGVVLRHADLHIAAFARAGLRAVDQ